MAPSADSFMRSLWPHGGSLLDKTFHSNLMSKESQAGLQFRQDLMKDMPPGIVSWDHAEAVNGLAQGQVAMITEWSAFYPTLTDPKTSKIGDCLGVAPEPAGEAGRLPALGGFSLAVASQAPEKVQKAAWIFIQWATSDAIAKAYVEAGGVSGRTAIYEDPAIKAKYSFVEPMVDSAQSQEIVRSTVALAHSLGMKVIAESVETEGLRQILQQMKCDFGQGWDFGRPARLQELVVRYAQRGIWSG